VCDHLVLLTSGRVQLAGDVDQLLREHPQPSLSELVLAHMRAEVAA
jgi:ABC-2 type transport system ATP-binding protein